MIMYNYNVILFIATHANIALVKLLLFIQIQLVWQFPVKAFRSFVKALSKLK